MKKVFTIYFLFCASTIFAQNTTCNTADPFCTGTNYTFPASTNAPAPTGAYFDCLGTQPNPAFYFLEIDNPGNITINIQGLGVNGGTNDIDFICWGPFTNPNTMCNQLTAGNVEDCSYSWTWNEFCNITGASSGDYYVLLITNFSNQPCNINFQQTSGTATTNCCILGGSAGGDNNITRCEDAQQFDMFSQLTGNPDPGGTWYNPANLAVSNIFNPSVSQSGIYSYIVPGSSSSCPDDTAFLTINVNSLPNVSLLPFADLCDNEQTINLNSGTPNGGIYTVNGNISNTFTPSPFNIGTNNITYSYTDINGCSSSISQSITVNETPNVITTTTNASCSGYSDGSAVINISGGTPSYNTNWFGVNSTQLSAGTYSYTVTDQNNCTFTDSIIIYEPSTITSTITHTNILCFGDNDGTAVLELQGHSAPAGTTSVLTYCTSQPGSNMTTNIENVELIGDIFNISNNTSGICDSYEDYTNLFADITQGQNYTINVTLGDCSPNNYPSGAKVFIDWNIDGDFNDVGEHVGTIPNLPASVFSIPITVPFIGFGATRMRVVSQFLNNLSIDSIGPCDVGLFSNPNYQQPWFGATEDYSIVINSPTVNATYIWSNGLTSDSIYGLSAGNYTVTITDNFGCITTDSVNITQPTALNVNYTTSNPNCHNGADGDVSINITGGISDYSVSLDTSGIFLFGGTSDSTYYSPQTLSAGNYNFNVIDSNNCIFTDSFTIINPQQIISNLTETHCDSYYWNGVTYFTSSLISNTFTSSSGCDSIVELNLSINNSSLGTTTISTCNSYLWDGISYNLSGTYTNTYTNNVGCDSIHTLDLTINYSDSGLSLVTSCDEFVWDGVLYTSSGTYTNNYNNAFGCDSIHILDLTINNSTSGQSTIFACDSYLWDGISYNSSGTYTNTYTNTAGCDSIHTLILIIGNSNSGVSTVTSCNNYTWDGITFSITGTYTNIYTNASGCDSIHTLNLTIDPSYSGDSTFSNIIACDDYNWDGITYTSSGIYTNTYTNTAGCDSIHTLNLTVNNSNSSVSTIIACDDYNWDGITYTSSGIYTNTYTNTSSCDSIHTLNLTINNSNNGVSTIIACDDYIWDGITYNSSGIYTNTYTNTAGCDSVYTLNLTINQSDTSYTNITACDSYTWNDSTYTQSGSYSTNVSSNNNYSMSFDGLDDYIDLGQNLFTSNIGTMMAWVKLGSGVSSNSVGYLNRNPIFSQTEINSNGNHVRFILTNNSNENYLSDSLMFVTDYRDCNNGWPHRRVQAPEDYIEWTHVGIQSDGNTWYFYVNGIQYNYGGENSLNGQWFDDQCNAVVKNFIGRWKRNSNDEYFNGNIDDLQLWDIVLSQQEVQNYMNCPPTGNEQGLIGYWNFEEGTGTTAFDQTANGNDGTINGATYDTSVPSQFCQSTNVSGCDSTAVLNLTINNSNTGTSSVTACDTYSWDGVAYISSGLYTNTYTNAAGCDSIHTLNLTIDPFFNGDSTFSYIIACDDYNWDGITYTSSGIYTNTYTNTAGCDSIHTLNLTVNNNNSGVSTIIACDDYNWNGITYTSSGIYTNTYTNTSGCDSIHTLNLTINNSNNFNISITRCDEYIWNNIIYNVSGNYLQTFTNQVGCDSTVNLNLVIVNGSQDLKTTIVKEDVSCFGYNDGNVKLFVSGGIPPYIFNWSNGQITNDIYNLQAGNYNFTISDSIGCKLDSFIVINEPKEIQSYFSLSSDTICRYDSVIFEINITNPQNNYYTVTIQDSILKSFVIDSTGRLLIEKTPIFLTPNFNTNIGIKEIIDESGCMNTINDSLPLIVNQLPLLSLTLTDKCFGDESFSFPVSLENEGVPEGGIYYIDNKLLSFFDVKNLPVGEYLIGYDYTDPLTTCSNFIENKINIYPKPSAYFSFSPQPAFINNPNISFIDKSIGMYYASWDLGDGSIIYDSSNFSYQYNDTGQYVITYTILNEFLCADSIIDSLKILPNYQTFIPNSFTPNNDGNNDFFKPEMLDNGSVKNYSITIYNKWGGIIFNEENVPWDGKNKGKICPIGTYSYNITIVDFKKKVFQYTGTVKLLK